MGELSPSQLATRRRAYGRALATRAAGMETIRDAIETSPDRQYLTPAEEKALAKALGNLRKVSEYVDKLSSRLDPS